MIASRSNASATALRKAFELARQGKLGDTEAICREILRHQADHSEALFLRAVIEAQSGRTAEAAESIRRTPQPVSANVSSSPTTVMMTPSRRKERE